MTKAGEAADLTVGPPGTPAVGTEPVAPDAIFTGDELAGEDAPPEVTEAQVRILLKAVGGATCRLVNHPDVPDLWRFRDDELDEIVPPFVRVINRPGRERLRRIVHRSDELSLALALASYAGRNTEDLRKARKAHDDDLDGEADRAQGGGATAVGAGAGWPGHHGAGGGGVPAPDRGGPGR